MGWAVTDDTRSQIDPDDPHSLRAYREVTPAPAETKWHWLPRLVYWTLSLTMRVVAWFGRGKGPGS